MYSHTIWRQAIESVRSILEAMERLGIPLKIRVGGHEVEKAFAEIHQYGAKEATFDSPSKELVDVICSLWADDGFQSAYKRRNEYQLNDNAAYFIKSIDRIATPEYVPPDEEILRTKQETAEFTDTTLEHMGSRYAIIDSPGAGAQQNGCERISEHTSTILFTIDPTAYSRVLPGDEPVDRMQEQLSLFESTVNDRRFLQTEFIVVLTKMDLLEDYLRDNDANKCFGAYSGLDVVDTYAHYLEGRLLGLISSDEVRERTRVVRSNLVDVGRRNPALDIIAALQSFAGSYSEKRRFAANAFLDFMSSDSGLRMV